jgi:hypothetical protein
MGSLLAEIAERLRILVGLDEKDTQRKAGEVFGTVQDLTLRLIGDGVPPEEAGWFARAARGAHRDVLLQQILAEQQKRECASVHDIDPRDDQGGNGSTLQRGAKSHGRYRAYPFSWLGVEVPSAKYYECIFTLIAEASKTESGGIQHSQLISKIGNISPRVPPGAISDRVRRTARLYRDKLEITKQNGAAFYRAL